MGLPLGSVVMPMPLSFTRLPKRCDHRWAPLAEYLATTTSVWPPDVNQLPPKFVVPWKSPVAKMLPDGSMARDFR
jgi:hypothetical protein